MTIRIPLSIFLSRLQMVMNYDLLSVLVFDQYAFLDKTNYATQFVTSSYVTSKYPIRNQHVPQNGPLALQERDQIQGDKITEGVWTSGTYQCVFTTAACLAIATVA